MSAPLVLVSHALCPYVQRAAIVLAEKSVPFERRDIDLAQKPDWFLKVSPLGKTPVLLVGDEAIFESSVICEYLDDTTMPRLHPANAIERARHRGWMEFGSSVLNLIGAFYSAGDESTLQARATEIRARLQQLEEARGGGPYFAGDAFSMVDAAFGPVFRYFDVFDTIEDFGFWRGLSKVPAWRRSLAARPSVAGAVSASYPELLRDFLRRRQSALGERMVVARIHGSVAFREDVQGCSRGHTGLLSDELEAQWRLEQARAVAQAASSALDAAFQAGGRHE